MMGVQLNEFVEHLRNNNFDVEIEEDKIKIFTNIEGIEVTLLCYLGDYFPYEIPKIFIDKESKSKLPKMPHIYTDNSICIFDKSKVIPNFNEPSYLLLDTIKEAINVLKLGITGKNKKDFIDEYLEYWSTNQLMKAQMFVENVSIGKKIHCCFIKEKILISDSNQRLKEIYEAIESESLGDQDIFEGIFIPVKCDEIDSIPQNDLDIVRMINSYSDFNKLYDTFMQNHIDKTTLIVFNQIISGENMVAGWIHRGQCIPNGFRKGHVNLKVVFAKSDKKGAAVAIDNCHQNRLFTRGGDGTISYWKKVGIIGCGSIGSFLADALKLSGVEKFVLVDNENLEYENIARHSCGYNSVSYSKVIDVGFHLQKWNPNITYEAYKENAHSFVEEKLTVINGCDVLFVAVASVAVEHHINKLILEHKINIPIVYIWVEPYCLGGHALLVKKPQDLYKEIFDELTFEYKYCIVNEASDYLKREAGCQSTYMPYSGFMLQQFIYRIVDCIMTKCWNKKGNFRLTWCGKLSEAKNFSVKIRNEYENVEDYSLILKRID